MDEVERRRREFVRAHHPDRGGDPDVFIAGLRRFDEEPDCPGAEPLPRVIVVAHRAWLVRLIAAVARGLRPDERVPRVR
ncbi:MAG TPA: hypothetical protein VLW50_12610 [Streptosporangiaceae bacterium]|nr:hypothetical protein [Streptosporangiaceae bacterium]